MDWSQASDAELLTATGTNVDAFAAFYDRYETAVVGYLLKRTRDIELALDLAAEVFAAALAGARRYRSQRDCAAPWLFTIAHSKLADSVRRGRVEARARQRLGIRDRIEYGDDEFARIESIVSQSGWATDLLQRLPTDQREAIRARIVDERPYDEIAQELKTSTLIVRKRVSRGLETLRRGLEEAP